MAFGTWGTLADAQNDHRQLLGTVDSGEQLNDSRSPSYLLGWLSIYASVLGVLLVLYCTLNPSGNPTSKSQVCVYRHIPFFL
jgi:hypothetical protein